MAAPTSPPGGASRSGKTSAKAAERHHERHQRTSRILVTGSADGLGRLTADTLLAEKHDVVVHARSDPGHFAPASVSSLEMAAVILDVGFRPQDVGDLFLRTRRDGLVFLQLRDARLVRAGHTLLRGMLLVDRHGKSFGR